jgi:hypothetical protein
MTAREAANIGREDERRRIRRAQKHVRDRLRFVASTDANNDAATADRVLAKAMLDVLDRSTRRNRKRTR